MMCCKIGIREVAETAQVKACQCFLPSLCWAMVLLGVFMTMGALIMGILAFSKLSSLPPFFGGSEETWGLLVEETLQEGYPF